MTTGKVGCILSSAVVALTLLANAPSAQAQVRADYRNGFGFSTSQGELRLNLFIRPRFEYESDDGTGHERATMELDLVGVRARAYSRRGHVSTQLTGGVRGQEPVLLDTFLDLNAADEAGLRLGYFRVPFDEQTTHSPFMLRMTDKSVDVRSLAHDYDLGLAFRGRFFDDAVVVGLSVTNGEAPTLENANLDFLYSGRLAVRLGPLLDWDELDLIVGSGTSWTLTPWEPEADRIVNQSHLNQTLDLTLRWAWLTATAAVLYRWTEPGAYGDDVHSLGFHVEAGIFFGRYLELALRGADLIGDLENTSDSVTEVAAAINAFADRGRLRFQAEYAFTLEREAGSESDAHRVVLQCQALY